MSVSVCVCLSNSSISYTATGVSSPPCVAEGTAVTTCSSADECTDSSVRMCSGGIWPMTG